MTTTNDNTSALPTLLLGLIASAAIGLSTTSTSADLTDDVADLFNANIQGGEWGFLLKEVDGPTLASVNPDYLFYPASSIKVLQHVHAMRMVEMLNNGIDLTTQLQVYVSQNDACDTDHTGQQFNWKAMDDTLRDMMENSFNQDTNAVQEFFGRNAINATIHGVGGMSQATQLNHRFGGDCGGPQQNQNQMPLSDAATLYERIALGQVFNFEGTRNDFYDLMLNIGYFDDLIDEEAPEGMSAFQIGQFKSQVRHCRKGGNWGELIKSNLGWVEIPAPPCSGDDPKGYTFGMFWDNVDSVDEDFGTQTAVYAMLRNEFRQALNAWQTCVACGEGGACDEAHAGPGCDDASCCDSVCAADPLCCTISWDPPCVNLAINLCGLGQDNDDCGDATPMQHGFWKQYDISNTTNDGPNHEGACGWNTEFIKDVWFEYTAECDGLVEIESSAGFDSWVAVYDTIQCPVTDNDLIACHQFGVYDPGYFEVCMNEGQTYKIRVGAGNPTQALGQIRINCGTNGYDNGNYQLDPNGMGLPNAITADDFVLGCDGMIDWINVQVVNPDGGGPGSTLLWHVYQNSAAGGGPGVEIANGYAVDLQITPIDAGGSGAPDSFFDIVFDLEIPLTLPAGTYWFGFSSPGVLPLPSDVQNGQPAHSQAAGGGWQTAAGDIDFALSEGAPFIPCPGDTNGDGLVNTVDLINVLADWGTVTEPNNGDVNDSGLVDVGDLLLVLENWGSCA